MTESGSAGTPVHFDDMRTREGSSLLAKTQRVFTAAGLESCVSQKDLVAIKLHWGEVGNLAYLAPPLVRTVVDLVKDCGAKPFLTDANTLYRGGRRNAVDHILTAYRNGFTPETVGAPIVVSDGLRGMDYVKVKGSGIHFKELKISSAVHYADALIVLSHFKGHVLMGFGGAIKNLGMGCAAPAGKQSMHSDLRPAVKRPRCLGCGSCVKHCPSGAARLGEDGKAAIDQKLCIGCGDCTVVCPEGAIPVRWKTDGRAVLEKTVEYAMGAVEGKKGKCGFMNFLMRITPDCDCLAWNDTPITPDLGILAARDPVAIDQASVDLVNRAPAMPDSRLVNAAAEDKFREVTGVDWEPQLAYAEKLGLGSRRYELVRPNAGQAG
ncbi:MAG: DUF362 domain-containing protein [bacterium]